MLPENIRILLIDDHPLFRKGLHFLLTQEYGLHVVAEASDGLEGVKLARYHRPDIVLLDLDMPLMNGKEALVQILNHQPQLPILILTVSENNADVQACLNLGARGYVLKNADGEFIVQAIAAAIAGKRPLSPGLCLSADDDPNDAAPLTRLTARETEVFHLVAQGLGNRDIARKMNLSENTVKVYVQRILKKLALQNRMHIMIYAAKVLGIHSRNTH